MLDLTLVIPVKETKQMVARFVNNNKVLLENCAVIVVNKKGGNILSKYAFIYEIDVKSKFWEARKKAYGWVTTKYTMNLDVGAVVSLQYVKEALALLDANPDVAVVSTDWTNMYGHLQFGVSIWRTEILRALYDWKRDGNKPCECVYMWQKVRVARKRIETLPYRAIKLRDES